MDILSDLAGLRRRLQEAVLRPINRVISAREAAQERKLLAAFEQPGITYDQMCALLEQVEAQKVEPPSYQLAFTDREDALYRALHFQHGTAIDDMMQRAAEEAGPGGYVHVFEAGRPIERPSRYLRPRDPEAGD